MQLVPVSDQRRPFILKSTRTVTRCGSAAANGSYFHLVTAESAARSNCVPLLLATTRGSSTSPAGVTDMLTLTQPSAPLRNASFG